jgi:hypothetical protein
VVTVTRKDELKAREREAKRREFSGQSEGEPLVEWLNSGKKRKPQTRVIELLRLLAESVRVQIPMQGGIPGSYWVARPFYRKIARLLSRYRFTPDLRLTYQGYLLGPSWRLPSMKEPYDERKAIWAIIRLVERGRVSAIHECDGCGMWIFTKKSDHATCSDKCRARKQRKNFSEWQREQARKKARDRYWARKNPHIKKGRRAA